MTATTNENSQFPAKLGVIGAPPHWIDEDGTAWAYEPYVREMQIWADLFSCVRVCGPLGEGSMKGNLIPYHRKNVEFRQVDYSMSLSRQGRFKRLFQFPSLILNSYRTISDSDFVLLRSPGHFSLAGAVLVRCLRRSSITKWAGENGKYNGERLPSRLNRWIENFPNQRHAMLVYGPPKRPHQIGFFPAVMSNRELETARRISAGRRWTPPWRIISVGRLERVKGFDLALRGLGELRNRTPGLPWEYTVVGDGPERESLESLANELGVGDRVKFTGALSFEDVQRQYASSHVVIMPGIKEGWPKVIAEAWAHGAIPVAASAGLIPWILGKEKAGVLFEPSPEKLSEALAEMLQNNDRLRSLSERIVDAASELSLESFKTSLETILTERYSLTRRRGSI